MGKSGDIKLPKVINNFTLQTYVKDTLQCLEEIMCHNQETDNVILFGHGVGGLLAALLAAQNPGIVKGLVLHAPIFKVF